MSRFKTNHHSGKADYIAGLMQNIKCMLVRDPLVDLAVPLSIETLAIATAGVGLIDHGPSAQYCISGKQNYKVIQPFQKIIMKNCWICTTRNHALSRARLPWARKTNGYGTHAQELSNPCTNRSYTIKSASSRNAQWYSALNVPIIDQTNISNDLSEPSSHVSRHPGRTHICRKI